MEPARQLRVADVLRRRFAASSAARSSIRLVHRRHPGVGALVESRAIQLADEPSIAVGIVGQDIVVGDLPIPRSRDTYGELTAAEVARHRAHRLRARRSA